MTGKKILVTGYAGFIGSNLVKKLNELDFIVDGVEDLKNIQNKLYNVNKLKLRNVFDKSGTPPSFDRYDTVVHLGADSSTGADGESALNNFIDFKDKFHRSKYSKTHLIFASSAGVYGNSESNVEDPKFETPITAYGYSKKLSDDYIREHSDLDLDDKITSLRFFNCYGPGEDHKEGQNSPVTRYLHLYLCGYRPEVIHGYDGNVGQIEDHKRDFVWVGDVVDVIVYFIENPQHGIFNVGSGESYTFSEVAQKCYEAADTKLSPVHELDHRKNYIGESGLFFKSRANNPELFQRHTKADLTKLRDAGYKKEMTSLEDGIRKTLEAIKNG